MKGNNLKKKIAYILSIVFLLTSVYTGNFSYAETDKKGNFAIETDGYITVDGGNIYKKITEVTGFENKKIGDIYIDKGGEFGLTCASYNQNGSAKNTVDAGFNLNFNDDTTPRETTDKKLSWAKDTNTDSYILTLDNIYLEKDRDITLPTGKKVTIKTVGDSEIDSQIIAEGGYSFDITITGEGTLNIKTLPSGGIDNDTLTIQSGTKVYVKDRISYGASGAANSFLNVKGEGTLLDIDTSGSYGTILQEINVTDGAELNIRARRIGAYTIGSINVTKNSKLKAACQYGVYILEGKLVVDDTSTLETDATSAGIVILDKTNAKKQAEVLSVPDVPNGTDITSVVKNGSRLWTIAKIGAKVEVVGNDLEPAEDITSALSKMTIKKRTDIGTGFTAKLDKAQYEHTGSEIKAEVTVKDGFGKVLVKDKDYMLSYQNNINITTDTSKAKVIVTGIGDYKGEITLTFDIVKTPSGGSSGGGSSGGGTKPDGGTSKDDGNKTDDKKADPKKFDDVKKDDWYHDSVVFVVEKGYMTGISENKFAPNMSTSRAMINQIIYNLEKRPKTTTKHNFIDVNENVWYEQSLNFTFDKGIIVGFPDKTFRGNSIITREQLSAILYRYARYKGYDMDTDADMSKYKDFKKAGNWAKTAIKWAVKHNIMKGRTNTSIDPTSELTRAELATVLKNFHSEFMK